MFPVLGAFNGQVVAAAGSSATDAAEIGTRPPAIIHATGANGTKGIILPPASKGKVYLIKNDDAANNTLKVYPQSSDGINAITVGSPIVMAAKTAALFAAIDGVTWFTFSLLPS